MYPNSSMNFDSFFVLGDSEPHENICDIGQFQGIDQSTGFDWLPATAAHLESHSGPEIPHNRTLLGPTNTALTMMDYHLQLNGDSNMADAGLCYENKATSTDWNNFNTNRIQDLDLPGALSILTDEEQQLTVGQHPALTEPGPQAIEPPAAANHHLDGTEPSSVKHATSEDWAKHRGLITSLYEKMTLPEVMRHMKQEKGFSATIKMYKSRFTLWGLDGKNNREREMRAAVRKRSQRTQQGKRSVVRIRGKPVDYQEMVRYFARKRLSIEDALAQRRASKTPEAVVCLTPITSPIAIPEVYKTPQLLFTSICDYVDGSFRSGLWIKTKPTEVCRSARGASESACRLLQQCYEVRDLLDLGHLRAAKLVQDSAIGSIHQMLLDEDPFTLAQLFDVFVRTFKSGKSGRHEIALAVFKAIADIGASTLGQQHPLPRVAGFLLRVDCSDIAEVGAKCVQAFGDQFEDVLGPMHMTSLYVRLWDDRVTDRHLRSLLHRCQSDLGVGDTRTMEVYLVWLKKLYRNGDDGLAAEECYKMLSHTHSIQDTVYAAELRAHFLRLLARCENMLSKHHLATVHLREAIDIRISLFGSLDGVARRGLLRLQWWLTDYGGEEEAAEVQRWWELMMQAEVASQQQAIRSIR